MSIRINKEKCVGCGKCADVCPGTLISIKSISTGEKKANMDYPRDCWGCVSCVKECSLGAIEFFLGADIGGAGSTMNVTTKGNILQWNIVKPDESISTIEIDRRNANQY